jgi:poly(ADP-ribose)glycohydrolase PARG
MKSTPLDRVCFDAAKLLRDHPPRWHHPNKSAVFDIARSSSHPFEGQIMYARWPEVQLPEALTTRSQLRVVPGVFTYVPNPASTAVEWHLNFADPNLFVAYGSALLAQDELQVAEHPVLGSLREALLFMGKPAQTVDSRGRPTPVTISGVQRRCAIDTSPNPDLGRPVGLYGNAFARAPVEDVIAATRPLSPPRISNILAMAAPVGGHGVYRRDDIVSILSIAYSGFLAARSESAELSAMPSRTQIHTGFWGCGAFGGNRSLMTILQALAAELADVDAVFHAFDDAGVATVEGALGLYADRRDSASTVSQIVDALVRQSFLWGKSDGN